METNTQTTTNPITTPSSGNGKKYIALGALVLVLGGAFLMTRSGTTLKGSFIGGGTNCPTISDSDKALATHLLPDAARKNAYLLSAAHDDGSTLPANSITWESKDLPQGVSLVAGYMDNEMEVKGDITCPFIFHVTVTDVASRDTAQKAYYIDGSGTATANVAVTDGKISANYNINNTNTYSVTKAPTLATMTTTTARTPTAGATAETRTPATGTAATTTTTTTRTPATGTATTDAGSRTSTTSTTAAPLVYNLTGTLGSTTAMLSLAGPLYSDKTSPEFKVGMSVLVGDTSKDSSPICAVLNKYPTGPKKLSGAECRQWYRGKITAIDANSSNKYIVTLDDPKGPLGATAIGNVSYQPNLAFITAHPGASDLKEGSQIIAKSPATGNFYTATVQFVNTDGKTAYVTTNDDHTVYEALPFSSIFVQGINFNSLPMNQYELKKFW
ncbi:MAG: hypothetical protein NTX63_02300 [Candidatus Peregrinibacteria bacterium]|nr:hypothetical protein [Candidatus Peregrinibacteria bacterium]